VQPQRAVTDAQYCRLPLLFCDGIVSRGDFLQNKKIFTAEKYTREKNYTGCYDLFVTKIFLSYFRHTIDPGSSDRPSRDNFSHFRSAHMFADTDALQFLGFFAPLSLLCGAIALIDIRRGIIPNGLNLSIAGLGLLKAVIAGGVMAGAEAGCTAAAIGFIFWLLRRLYFALRKTQGLGLGDVKFLAAAALWIGVRGIPTLLLIATLTALAAAGSLQLAGRGMTRQTSLPFGPFLAIGLLLTLILQQFLSAV
jgi:leader peptidase (prepilin peptidase) / N-methyltransferase